MNRQDGAATGSTAQNKRKTDGPLALLVEQAQDYALVTTDADGRVTDWSAGAERILGWSAADVVGRPGAVIFTPEDVAAGVPGREMAAAEQAGRADDTRWHVRKDGSRFLADGVTVPLRDAAGSLVGFGKILRDVTDRHGAAEHLARVVAEADRRKRLYEAVLNSTPDLAYVWDLDHRFAYANEGLLRMWGKTWDEAIGKTCLELGYAPWHAEMHDREIERVRATKQPVRGEVPFTGTLGRRVYDYLLVPVLGPTGEVEAVAGTTRDVTERTESEERLRASEERFRQLAETIPNLAWMARPDGHIFWYNRRWYEYTGTTPDQMAGWGWQGVHDPAVLPDVLARWRRSLATGEPFDMVFPLRGADGGFRPFLTLVNPLRDAAGGVVFWFGTNTDISAQKRAEEDLARSLQNERRQAETLARVALASRSINAVLSVDSITRILAEEARAILHARLSGIALSAEGGSHTAWAVSSPVHYSEARAEFDRLLGTGLADEVCRTNRPVRTLGPGRRGVLAVPLVAHGGGNLGLVCVVGGAGDDFTAGDEAVLTQLAAIATVGVENARLYERLREQDRRKDEFLATLAHELRNPLAPLRNGVVVLRAGRSPAAHEKMLGMMERQLGHLVRLVDDLLDVSRVTTGKVTLRAERLDLRDVVDAAVETSRPLIEASGHRFEARLPAGPLPLDGDRTRLAQVLTNVLNNAAKYTPEGGAIVLSAERDGSDVVVRVADTGAGIPADMLPRVFEVFTQVNRTLDRAQGGLGLGLALVRKLVEMHGGSVWAESPGPGRGSTFGVRLPLARADRPAAPESDAAGGGASAAPGRRILVVDDNVDAADSLVMLLNIAGHATETAYSGPAAVEKAKAFRPEVVFLDIGLPGMSGYEVAAALRADPDLCRAVLVALTGWGTSDDRRRALDAGFDAHLTKPADTERVMDLLATLLPGGGRRG